MSWYEETLYRDWRQTFSVTKELFREKTEFQDLVIFENPLFGRVLALDGVIQVTEGDEYVYHEMMAHVPILAHGEAKNVLIVGGGDGGVLREVLKHPGVERATMVEIDRAVVDLCVKYMPGISAGAFDHPKTDLIIADGLKYMAEIDKKFDCIIVDSTDPAGPGEVLFTEQFYTDCRKRLTERGILVTQNGVPRMQPEELTVTHKRREKLYKDASFFVCSVPTYVGGFMALGWASQDPQNRRNSAETIRTRFQKAPFKTRYYTPEVHAGAFALPQYVLDLMS